MPLNMPLSHLAAFGAYVSCTTKLASQYKNGLDGNTIGVHRHEHSCRQEASKCKSHLPIEQCGIATTRRRHARSTSFVSNRDLAVIFP